MEKRLNKLTNSPFYEQIKQIYEQLTKQIERFMNLSYNEQTFYSKQLSKQLNSFYETVVAVEWAERFGKKYEALAEIYIESEWNLRQIGDEMITVKYFGLLTK